MSAETLQLRGLGCERDERPLFAGLDLACRAGDLIQVLGPNGSGKTTLLRVLAGISRDYTGELLWGGHPLKGARRWAFARQLLYIGHMPGIKGALTPRENLSWYSALAGDTSAPGIDAALRELGILACAETPCQQLSAGQLRRVALARLFLSRASLWILDEPFTAIDQAGVAALQAQMMLHAERGGLVIFTSHQQPNLARLRRVHLPDYCAGGEGAHG